VYLVYGQRVRGGRISQCGGEREQSEGNDKLSIGQGQKHELHGGNVEF